MESNTETTTRKRNERKKIISLPATSNRRIQTSIVESSRSRETSLLKGNLSKNEKPNGDKTSEEYENEYCLYLLRKLQRKIMENETKEREFQAKQSLVALKKEYQKLLEEHVRLYQQCKKTQMYGYAIDSLNEDLDKGGKVLKILKETCFIRIMSSINDDFEQLANGMALLDLKKKDVEDAFEKGFLGFNSSVFKLLKEMKDYADKRGSLVPEIVQELKEIERINSENEILRKKCCEFVEEVRSRSIKINCEKFYNMALEACKSVRDATKFVPASECEPHVRKSEGSGFKPCSSSTPS